MQPDPQLWSGTTGCNPSSDPPGCATWEDDCTPCASGAHLYDGIVT